MPSRLITLGIVLCWLVVNGWLFWHDLLPRLLPGQPPPYYVDITAEAQNTNRPFVNWTLSLDDKVVGQVKTRVEHLAGTGYYDLVAKIKPEKFGGAILHRRLHLAKIESAYRVAENGDLLGLSALVEGTFGLVPSRVTIQGDVARGQLTPRVKATVWEVEKFALDLDTADTPQGATVLMPLHPVNRWDVHRGQEWNVYFLDLLGVCDASGGMSLAHARVRPEEVLLDQGRYRSESCLVIDFEADDLKVTTWVASRNGLVICQESTTGSTRWTINRE